MSTATYQYGYFSKPKNGYASGAVIIIMNTRDEAMDAAFRNLRSQGVQPGDLVYFIERDSASGALVYSHAVIITKVDSTGVYYSGNTYTRQNESLENALRKSDYAAVFIVRINNDLPAR